MKFYIVQRHLIRSHSYPVYAMSLNHISTIIKHAENRIELVCVCVSIAVGLNITMALKTAISRLLYNIVKLLFG